MAKFTHTHRYWDGGRPPSRPSAIPYWYHPEVPDELITGRPEEDIKHIIGHGFCNADNIWRYDADGFTLSEIEDTPTGIQFVACHRSGTDVYTFWIDGYPLRGPW